MGSYVPNLPFQHGKNAGEEMRWEDEASLKNSTARVIKKPKFHLLVPAMRPSANLCKTLLSAAILNYPPPTLINYMGTEGRSRNNAGSMRSILQYLLGKETRDDDLVLVVEANTLFQLPAEVMINRFLDIRRYEDARLLAKYGKHQESVAGSIPSSQRQPKFSEKVLFGAGKTCVPNLNENPSCYSPSQSPLSELQFGNLPANYTAPRFLESGATIGKVSDLRQIFEDATRKLDQLTGSLPRKYGSQYLMAEVFGEQEYVREVERKSSQSAGSRWTEWLAEKLGTVEGLDPNITYNNMTIIPKHNYELGMGLDYTNSIFQILNNSIDDVKFLKFADIPQSNQTKTAHGRGHVLDPAPTSFPMDLNRVRLPLQQHKEPMQASVPAIKPEIDAIPRDLSWADISLVVNTMIPGTSVPAALHFHGHEDLLEKWWSKMWYQPYARALLRQSMRSSQGSLAAAAAAEGGDRWWDLRGGKGGVWTDRGKSAHFQCERKS
jgi:hypothetical protein